MGSKHLPTVGGLHRRQYPRPFVLALYAAVGTTAYRTKLSTPSVLCELNKGTHTIYLNTGKAVYEYRGNF